MLTRTEAEVRIRELPMDEEQPSRPLQSPALALLPQEPRRKEYMQRLRQGYAQSQKDLEVKVCMWVTYSVVCAPVCVTGVSITTLSELSRWRNLKKKIRRC